MAANTSKNAPAKHAAPPPEVEDDAIDTDAAAQAEWDSAGGEEVVASGFPPYVKPTVGGVYVFTPLFIDARNPKFIRVTCRNDSSRMLMGATGPVDSAEAVPVQPGELFSFSDYKGLPFEELIGLKVTAKCTERRKMPDGPNGPRAPMFIFAMRLSSDDAKTFNANKTARLNAGAAAARALTQAQAATAAGNLPVSPSHTAGQQQLRS